MIMQPPPMSAYQMNTQFNNQDESHLKVISICHFVMGGLYLLGIGFLILHFMLMSVVFRMAETQSNKIAVMPGPTIVQSSESTIPSETTEGESTELLVAPTPPVAPAPVTTTISSSAAFPKEIIPFFIGFYVVMGGFLVILCVCNVLSGLFIRKRKNRVFTFIVAGINCMQVPLGTALGVFTFIVLSRESVKMAYNAKAQI